MTEDLLLEVSEGIARMTINRPQARNALTPGMIQAMLHFCQKIELDGAVRCLVITGAGEHFMAGGDVKGFLDVIDLSPEELRSNFMQRSIDAGPLWSTLERLPQPVLCSVRGFAAGVALSLVAGADLVVASDTAKFLLAHVGLGLVPDGATTYHLPRAIGARRAKQMAFFGDRIDAAEALQMGLINWVVPDAELDAKTDEIARRLASAPSVSIAQAKLLMNRAQHYSIEDQLAGETFALGRCAMTGDLKEGVRAFVEKRKPQFRGQ